MAVQVFTDALILHGEFDVSGDFNETKLEYGTDVLERTRFGHTTRDHTTGLWTVDASGKGWLQVDDSTTPKAIDKRLWDQIGGIDKPYSVAPTTTDGEIAFITKGVQSKYSPSWPVGQLPTFDFAVKGNKKVTRGRLALPLAARTVTGNGTDYQLGALSASQYLVAALHVTEFSGTSLVVRIRSAAASGMASPTTRITFATATGVTSEYAEVLGAITDTWFDVDYTITSATAKFAVTLGIRS